MDSLIRTYHDVRFHVDHFIVSYRQRYYSLDKNPRVIQTKLHNQQLISLRTFPHDKYIVEPTRFLNLGDSPITLNKTSNDESEDDNNRDFTVYNIDELISFDDTYSFNKKLSTMNTLRRVNSEPTMKENELMIFDFNDKTFDLRTPDFDKEEPQVKEEEIRSSPPVLQQPPPCGCLCHVSQPKKPKVGQKFFHFVKSNINKVTSKGSEFVVGEYDDIKSEKSLEEPNTNIKELISPIDKFNSQPRFTPKITPIESRRGSFYTPQEKPKSTENKKIWKLVLNDVSLSAARLSTGSTTPIVNSQNIRGDFIDAKTSFVSHFPQPSPPKSEQTELNKNNENEDIFAINLEHAKLKYLK